MQDMYMGNPLGSCLPITEGEPNKKTVWSSYETNKQINECIWLVFPLKNTKGCDNINPRKDNAWKFQF